MLQETLCRFNNIYVVICGSNSLKAEKKNMLQVTLTCKNDKIITTEPPHPTPARIVIYIQVLNFFSDLE